MPYESLTELLCFAPDTYAFRYRNHVSMFFVTDEGVLLVDPIGEGNTEVPALIKQAIRVITLLPVRYVVYSHAALDHSAGGQIFRDTARFVAQAGVVMPLIRSAFAATPLPNQTFDDRLQLTLGGRHFELYASALSLTDNYLLLHDKQSRIIMYVNIFQPESLPLRLHGPIRAMLRRLDWFDQQPDFDIVITGHATPRLFCTREELAEQRRYLMDLDAAIERARAAGLPEKSPEMIAAVEAELAPRYSTWRRFDCLATNVENAIDFAAGRSPADH